MSFEERLNQARNGKAVLFCGAGFSADCLAFSEDLETLSEIGAGARLLELLNLKLSEAGKRHGFQQLTNCADEYKKHFGAHGLLAILQSSYKITNTTQDMADILSYSWDTIFTTNYDNAIEHSLYSIRKAYNSLNNTSSPEDAKIKLPIVHLHGSAEHWDIHNFEESCVLGATSYLKLTMVKKWMDAFRRSMEEAEIVVFVGFNGGDLHLNEAIFDIHGLRDKVFFVNRTTANPDVDLMTTQEQFGTPVLIGREGLAEMIRRVQASTAPTLPSLSSFERFQRPAPSGRLPSVQQIEDLFIFGKFDGSLAARDLDFANRKSDYHLLRSELKQLSEMIDRGCSAILIVGEICDGKTILVDDFCLDLAVGRAVFKLKHVYTDILNELSSIVSAYPGAIIVVESCFDLATDRLRSILSICQGSNSVCVLTSRDIAAEAESAVIQELGKTPGFDQIRIGQLRDDEISDLIDLADQFFTWSGTHAYEKSAKMNLIKTTYRRSLPAFLMGMLKSQYVQDKYKAEYNKVSGLKPALQHAIVAGLYIGHVGLEARLSFLSDAFRIDASQEISDASRSRDQIKLVHIDGKTLKTVPSIGATNILCYMVNDSEIVDCLILLLEHLSEIPRHDDYEDYLYRQLMRYSIISSVVKSTIEINRFFDNTSKNPFYRSKVLFWLQWHMSKVDQRAFVDAESHLDRAYHEADAYEKRTERNFNRHQLDDRKAKFLMLRARETARDTGALFRDFSDSLSICRRLIMEAAVTHHPFETLYEIAKTFRDQGARLALSIRGDFRQTILELLNTAEKRVDMTPIGFQRSIASKRVQEVKQLINDS